MFQNPNDPCNFCLGGQCDSQSPGKAISRLSTRAPSSPSYGGIDRKRIITAVQSPGNQNQPLSLLTSDCAATERVWKRRHCTKYTGGRVSRVLPAVRSTSQLHETQDSAGVTRNTGDKPPPPPLWCGQQSCGRSVMEYGV